MLFLGVGYGMGEATLAGQLSPGTRKLAGFLQLYREAFPRLTAWTEEQCDRAVLVGQHVDGVRVALAGQRHDQADHAA